MDSEEVEKGKLTVNAELTGLNIRELAAIG